MVSLALSEMSWILNAGWYHIFSPDSYPSRTRNTLSHEFSLDVPRGAARCWWWALCLRAPSFHSNDLQVVCIYVLLMGVSRCSSDCALLLSAARLTVCIYIPRLKSCKPYYDVVNLLTVTKTNMIRWNALWLCKNHCCENTAPSLPQCCAAVSNSAVQRSPTVLCSGLGCSRSLPQSGAEWRRAAQRSQLLLKSPADLRRGLRSSSIWLFYKSNLVASWMRLHICRCFQAHLRRLLQSLRAHCVAPGRSGSI